MTVHANDKALVRCAYCSGTRTRLFLMPVNFLNIVDGDQGKSMAEPNLEECDGKQEKQEQHTIDYYCTH